MANGAFKFKDNSGNVVSFISGSGSNISFSGGTLDLSGMTGLTLGNLTLSGTTQNAISASHAASYLLTSSFNTYTGTTNTLLGTLQTSTSSLNSFTSSATTRLNSIEGVSGSYATTGSNQFKNDQVITGSLTVTGFIDAQELRTTYISSSILYRSGSTKFGDELSDTHAFTGSMVISGSVSTTGNVGIGTASPASLLTIFGAGNTLRLDSSSGADKEILMRSVGTGTGTLKTDGNLRLWSEDSGRSIIFKTFGGESSIDSSGAATFSSSVTAGGYITGQGTNPGGLGGSRYVLDWFNGMRVFSYGADTSTNGSFSFNSQRSNGTNSIDFLTLASTGAATFTSSVTEAVATFKTTSNNYGSVFFRIDSTEPTSRNWGFFWDYANYGELRIAPSSTNTGNPDANLAALRLARTGAATFSSSVTANGDITSTALEGKIRITSTAGAGKTYQFISIDTGNLGLFDGTAYRFWVAGSGNVGIGTTSPQSGVILDIRGAGAVAGGNEGLRIGNVGDNSAYDNVKLWYTGFSGGSPRIYLTPRTTPGSGVINTFLYLQNTNGTSTSSNNTMGLFVDGQVGIGTTSPGTKLEILSRAADADRTIPHNVLTITATQGNAPYGFFGGAILFKNSSYVTGVVESSRIRSVIYDDGAPNNFGGGLWFETTATPGGTLTPSLVLNYQGRVGIGTSAPLSPLHLQASEPTFRIVDSDDGGVTFIGSSGGYSYIRPFSRDFRVLNAAGVGLFTIKPSGNTGVGTTEPTQKLDVFGGGIAARNAGAGTFITGKIVPRDVSNQTSTIATVSSPGGNDRVFFKIQVINVSAVNNYGNAHVGYAIWTGSGSPSVTTMTLDTGNSNIGNTNVGSLSWSGNNLQYTTNGLGNYEHNHIIIHAVARDNATVV